MNAWKGNVLMPAKTIHYQPNGTGRDGYIHINSGGLMLNEGIKHPFSNGKLLLIDRIFSVTYTEWIKKSRNTCKGNSLPL